MTALSLSHKAAFLAVNGVVFRLVSLVAGIIVARTLPKELLGTFQQLNLVSGVLSPLFTFAIPGSILFFWPRMASREEKQTFLGQTVTLLSGLGLALFVTVNLGVDWITAYFDNNAIAPLMPAFSLGLFCVMVSSYFYSLMIADNRMWLATLHTVGFGCMTIVFQLAALLITNDIGAMVDAMALARVLQLVAGLLITARMFGFSWSGVWRMGGYRRQLAYAVPLALTGLIGTIGYQVDQLVIGGMFDPTVYAVYVIGAIEIPFVTLLQSSVNNVLIPEISTRYKSGDVEGIFVLWRAATRKLSLVMFPVFVVFFLVADDFILFLYTEEYRESVPYFRIYLLLTPLRMATYSLVSTAIGKTTYVFRGSVVFVAVNIAASFALVTAIGPAGAAVGTVFSSVVLASYHVFALRRILGFPIRKMLPWPVIAVGLVLALGIGAVTSPLLLALTPGFSRMAITGVAYSVLYFLVFRSVGIIRKSDVTEIGDWLRGRVFRMV